MRRLGRLLAAALLMVLILALAGCDLPLSTPGNTTSIQLVSTTTVGGWKYDYFRNTAYPCSISGYQTFVIGTKVGSSPTATAPLWVFMHGGGVGFFDSAGRPQPGVGQKTEESFDKVRGGLTNNGLLANLRADPAGFRTVAVSYCSHDLYAGANTTDANNPNTTPDGKPRPTTGLLATKAAVQYARAQYPTSKFFLHGGSAGSAGTYHVAWAMQLQGLGPAGVVGDASVVNVEAGSAAFSQGVCLNNHFEPGEAALIQQRVHPQIGNIANEVDKLIARGEFTVPVMHVWNHGDLNTCGSAPMTCPLRDGSQVTMGATDCTHEPLRAAIAGLGPASRSANLPLCVDNDPIADCSVHVVTTRPGLVNTDPASPVNYLGAIMNWVHARLADA